MRLQRLHRLLGAKLILDLSDRFRRLSVDCLVIAYVYLDLVEGELDHRVGAAYVQ